MWGVRLTCRDSGHVKAPLACLQFSCAFLMAPLLPGQVTFSLHVMNGREFFCRGTKGAGRGEREDGRRERKRNTQLQRDTALALQLPMWIETRWHAGTPAWLSEEPNIWLIVGRASLRARALLMFHITDCYSVSLHRKPKCLIPTAGAGHTLTRRTFNSLQALNGEVTSEGG